jgi:surfactin synthase thioesterase subunit
MNKIKIFCIPFAGGSKYSYRVYEELSPPALQLMPLEYPGRGSRIKEPCMNDIHSLVDDLYNQVKHTIPQTPYAIYGHSLGGVAAFLLTRKIISNGHSQPIHLFISGTSGPSAWGRGDRNFHSLDRSEFYKKVRSLEGMPETFFENEELLDFYEPILRSDFRVCETYSYQEEDPLHIPFTVMTGTGEDLLPDDICLWQKESRLPVDFIQLPGGHFFIFEHAASVIGIISKKLLAK